MRVRPAKYEDLYRVLEYLTGKLAGSDWERVPLDAQRVKQNLIGMIRTQDILDVLIAESKGEIRGVLLASVDTFFWSKTKYASDLHFVADGGGAVLLRAFVAWAKARHCAAVVMAVATMDERAERLYTAIGFQRVGGTMVRWLQEAQEQEIAA